MQKPASFIPYFDTKTSIMHYITIIPNLVPQGDVVCLVKTNKGRNAQTEGLN